MGTERESRVFQIRAISKAGKRTLVGRAAAFMKPSRDLGGFQEILKAGCFSNALKRGDEVIFCQNHNPDLIMSRTRNGTLRLRQSDGGLDFEADLPDTQAAADLWTLVSGGTISECSFSFTCDKDSWYRIVDDTLVDDTRTLTTFGGIDMASLDRNLPVRLVEDLHLWDTSAVSMPAYSGGVTHVGTSGFPEISGDPAATRPHMEGVSISQYALAEARARGGGSSRLLSADEALLVRVKAKALVIRLDDAEAE